VPTTISAAAVSLRRTHARRRCLGEQRSSNIGLTSLLLVSIRSVEERFERGLHGAQVLHIAIVLRAVRRQRRLVRGALIFAHRLLRCVLQIGASALDEVAIIDVVLKCPHRKHSRQALRAAVRT